MVNLKKSLQIGLSVSLMAASLPMLMAFTQAETTNAQVAAPVEAAPQVNLPAPNIDLNTPRTIDLGPVLANPTAPRIGGGINALPQAPAPVINVTPAPTPSAPPTKEEIARQIAPNFNVATEYNRLVQCYGTADFMAAFTRVRASRPGATPQLVQMANQISALKSGMQPMVLAASTVKTEPRFRADYNRVATNVQNQIARGRNPDAALQTQLRTLNSCSPDIRRWRGGQ